AGGSAQVAGITPHAPVSGDAAKEEQETGRNKMKHLLLAGVALAAITSMVSSANAAYALVMKGPGAGNPFWAVVEKGAKDKGAELGVEVIVVAPPAETDVQAQVTQVEDLIAQK